MGQELQEPQYGVDCGFCTPGTWPVNETPAEMTGFFTGIQICPVAPNETPPEGSYVMTQRLGTPCLFENVVNKLIWQAFIATTAAQALSTGGFWFSKLMMGACQSLLPNGIVACGGPVDDGALGTLQMSMAPLEETAWLLTDDYNFVPTDETWFNEWLLDTAPPPDKVIGLYNTKYRANVLIKYAP